MFRLNALLLGLVISMSASLAHAEPNLDRPLDRSVQEFNRMLFQGHFTELDQIAEKVRRNNTKLSDGYPVLGAIYEGTGGCQCGGDEISKATWQQRGKLLAKWRLKYPKSITAEIAQASFYLALAWASRGNGYADSVTADGWNGFDQNLKIAKSLLDNASSAAKNDAGWYKVMLGIGLAKKWDKKRFDALFNEGTDKYPTYVPLYFTAAEFHSDRWYGSEQEFEEFVKTSTKKSEATMGQFMYARIKWHYGNNIDFDNGQTDWPRMKQGFQEMLKIAPDLWTNNAIAKFACLAHDGITLREQFNVIGNHLILSAWKTQDLVKYCTVYAEATLKNENATCYKWKDDGELFCQ